MARPILSAISIFFLAGGIVLEFFVILSGAVSGTPLNLVYFLQADTNGILGQGVVPNPARWTYFSICSVRNGKNAACGPTRAALPFDPHNNFDASRSSLPPHIANSGSQYYYLSRVAWALYIIAIFFAVMAFLLSVTALCSRLAAKLTGLMTIIAVVMQAVAASLMTAWTVMARAAFRNNGQSAKLGKYAYGFTWAALACWIISTVLFCIGGSGDRGDSYQKSSYFGRKKSTRSNRSRGSFRDSESGRRVKDEYD